jgi:hypothetical protein
MEPDLELDGWRREWQAEARVPANLVARVARETRRMRYLRIVEILITVVFGGGSIVSAALARRDDMTLLAAGIWIFLAIAWLMSWLLRRGAWAPLAATTAAFLELSILRCQRRRDTIVAQCVLYLMILSFDLWFIRTHSPPHAAMDLVTFLTGWVFIGVWLITAALAVLAVRQRRRLDRELESLLALQRQVEGATRLIA